MASMFSREDPFKLKLLSIKGVQEALYGLGLSYGKTSNVSFEEFASQANLEAKESLINYMADVAFTLLGKGKGHDKFMRMIQFYVRIKAPTYWWLQFDTYKVGTTSQSESKMHTLMRKKLTQDDFSNYISHAYLDELNSEENLQEKCEKLPMSFLQSRVVNLNLAVFLNIALQRHKHIIPYWQSFIWSMLEQLTKMTATVTPNLYFPSKWLGRLKNMISYGGFVQNE